MHVRTPLALLSAALLLFVAACGSDGSGGDADADEPAGSGSGSTAEFEPVTIDHVYGSTEVEALPERIVSLDTQWTDALLALDETPVGYLADYSIPEGFPWRDDLLADSTEMTATDALPYEQIAALEPDLIVVTYFAEREADYEKLSAIAPTVATLSDNQVDTWQDITLAAGEILGQEGQAQEVIDEVDGQVAEVAAELPGLEGKTFALVNYVKGDAFYVVSDPEDGAVVLFTQLGMEISPEIIEAGDGASGRATISLERTDLLDADLLLLLTNGEDPSGIPGYDTLPAVTSGAVALLDYGTAVGINTPTPLSIPWALEELRPQLEAAAAS
ncbi:MAG: ABC transporter substrate-binding protein [Microthrixaceae bacterium]